MPTQPNKEVKFGIKFKDGYKIEMNAEEDHWLWPVAVYQGTDDIYNRYNIWDGNAHDQLFGQLMTLVEAIIEDPIRQKAVKSLVKKEMSQFEDYLRDVTENARPKSK